MRRLHFLVLVGVAAAAVGAACGGSPPPPPPPPEPNADSIAAERAREDSIRRAREEEERRRREEEERIRREAEERARTTEEVRNLLATFIHFDFDKSNIRPGDAAILDQKVAILRANPSVRIRISGHCDERGSDEYNLALGNRRATSAKQYLVNAGIDAGRIETVSFGEERPIAMGHDEESWAQNRRAEFEIIAGGDVLVRP
ncbi:MAG TPA: peptidoglycan-associated lipoprotein Pal [Gemmatimonadales bacterium]|nr:peptidoglycan-associated lipoprotein Pal [Gemmatimonadales bacterium]